MPKRIFINNQIRATEIRLIDEIGNQLGIVPLEEGLSLAKEKSLDLIQVTEKVEPPVCKIGNIGKYLYQEEKKEKHNRKNKGGELKAIRLTYNISKHDMETRANLAEKFLKKGDTVRIDLPLRGRQKALGDFGREKMMSFLESLNEIIPIKTEKELKREPRGFTMIISKK
ncbi:MAG: translation initiation factor IF-3 [Candidatus Nealsonbacteria bacterium]